MEIKMDKEYTNNDFVEFNHSELDEWLNDEFVYWPFTDEELHKMTRNEKIEILVDRLNE
jgi:hypothetical protein